MEEAGFIPLDDTKPFESNNASGKVVISGSSSVTPVMEKLQEAYQKINAKGSIEINQTHSTNCKKYAYNGTCDIGMASRELKDSELESLTSTTIATDGIAVIVNKANSFDDLTSDAIKAIFTGEAVNWSDVK